MDRSTENPGDDGHPTFDAERLDATAAEAVLGGASALGRALERWAAEASVDEAARARTRAHWLRVQSAEGATFVGTLIDLAERARPVVLEVAGQRVRGSVAGIGGDFVALRTDRRQEVLVRTSAIDVVRAEPGGDDVHGDRSALLDVGLDAVLGPVAAERPDVLARTAGGVAVRGELRSAGTDVISIRVDGDPPTPAWIPIASLVLLVIQP